MRLRFFLFCTFFLWGQSASGLENQVVTASRTSAAIASAHPLATEAGREVLQKGGNAFDAAVAVSAALAVVEPYSSGLGGGGFWLLHREREGKTVMVDGREKAPLASRRDMYEEQAKAGQPRASLDGPLAAAIPGLPAGMDWLSQRYGRLPLATVLAPAIRLAEDGFPVDARFIAMLHYREKAVRAYPDAKAVLLPEDRMPQEGDRFRQPQLAAVLKALARHGAKGFYQGWVGRELVRSVRAGGGIWSERDLLEYRVVEREPVEFSYRDARITTASLPSSGGLVLAQSLQILAQVPYADANPVTRMHLAIEAMRRAYQDRARYMGDSDFVEVPTARLLSPDYARQRASDIRRDTATSSETLGTPSDAGGQGPHTTHFSIVDTEGNRVSATLSINLPFGSAFVAGRTGVILNNEMDDFASQPGTPNAYGLVGSEANAIAPGKRPLSSMSPTFVEDARGILILGTPGGSRIISMVLLGILDYVHGPRVDIPSLVAGGRFHHQYLPDRTEVEPGRFGADMLQELELYGHRIEVAERPWGNMQAVYIDKQTGRVMAVSDPRGMGSGLAWY